MGRLVIIWTLFSTVPIVAIAALVLGPSNGWFVQKSAPVQTPILVLAAVSLLFGFRAMFLVARSISDPVREVVIAMRAIEQGRPDVFVEVYEPSEIGRLQSGFNRMVAGLAEHERLRICSADTSVPMLHGPRLSRMLLCPAMSARSRFCSSIWWDRQRWPHPDLRRRWRGSWMSFFGS